VLGDKTLFTMGSLAPRHRLTPLLASASVAVALKMLAAVALGGLIGHLPPLVVALVSAVTFLLLAFRLWRDVPEDTVDATQRAAHATTGWRSAALAFTGLFFTEWGDIGQITTASLVAKLGHPGLVWLAASAAMLTKILVGLTLGLGLKRWLSPSRVRAVSIFLCVGMAALSAFRIEV
jgi:Ca2+/H+ antiporter, TMEM165/GDT1 family